MIGGDSYVGRSAFDQSQNRRQNSPYSGDSHFRRASFAEGMAKKWRNNS